MTMLEKENTAFVLAKFKEAVLIEDHSDEKETTEIGS